MSYFEHSFLEAIFVYATFQTDLRDVNTLLSWNGQGLPMAHMGYTNL